MRNVRIVLFVSIVILSTSIHAQNLQGGGGAAAPMMETTAAIAAASRPATMPVAEGGPSVRSTSGLPFASDAQPRTDTQPNDLSLEGTIGYTIAGDRTTVNLRADRVANNRGGGVSGTIRLSFWATLAQPVYGNSISGYRMGYYQFTSTLSAGQYFSAVDRTVAFTTPPNGTYYISMMVDEYNGNNPSLNDGYSYHDLRVFSNQLTFGSANSAAIVDHAMTSGVDPSTLLNVNRLTSFSASAEAAISWIKLVPFLGPHTLQWKFFAPDGTLYYDTGASVQTGVAGYDYYAYYAGIQIAGAAAANKPGLWTARVYLDGVNSVTETFTIVAQNTGTCTPSSTKLCLNNNRFGVSVNWRTSAGQTGQGQAIKYTADSGLFWFFGSENIEMITKVLNACGLNQRYWLFAAATTDVEYTITVTDAKTGATKTYFHAAGSPAPAITDTGAFATCP